jgi:hypothetical protein
MAPLEDPVQAPLQAPVQAPVQAPLQHHRRSRGPRDPVTQEAKKWQQQLPKQQKEEATTNNCKHRSKHRSKEMTTTTTNTEATTWHAMRSNEMTTTLTTTNDVMVLKVVPGAWKWQRGRQQQRREIKELRQRLDSIHVANGAAMQQNQSSWVDDGKQIT